MNWQLLLQRWQAVPAREQRLLLLALALLSALLLWWLALAPAWQVLRSADAQQQALDGQLRLMQRMQAQVQSLRALPMLDAQESKRALEDSLKPLGQSAQMTQQMDRTSVSFKGIGAQALAQWLAAARQNAHAVPAEVHLKRAATGAWDGSVVFILAAP